MNFGKVRAAGYVGAWNKATQGTYFLDKYFKGNVAGERAVGMKSRAYHFYDDTEDPVAQARFFLAALVDGLDGAALDLEQGAGDQSGPALLFLDYVDAHWQRASGTKIDLYTNLDFLNRMSGAGKARLSAKYGLWLAYPSNTMPPVPSPWTRIDCWQKDWHGSVPGIVGDVDLDVMQPG